MPKHIYYSIFTFLILLSFSCNNIEVVGSIKELQEKAIEAVSDDVDLHKHVVDNIHLKCKCKSQMTRISEVFDCWFESGSMPYAAKHYPFENKEWFKDNFPADFISEYVAQVRAWFYYMHVISVMLFDNRNINILLYKIYECAKS